MRSHPHTSRWGGLQGGGVNAMQFSTICVVVTARSDSINFLPIHLYLQINRNFDVYLDIEVWKNCQAMNNTLTVDLNELVSQQVSERIKELEDAVSKYVSIVKLKDVQIRALGEEVHKSKVSIALIGQLRESFLKITEGVHDSGDWYDSKQKNQFLFIEDIMLRLFNIKREQNGWLSSRSDGRLKTYLAVNYYSNKETLINLVECLMSDASGTVSFIRNFKMPYDYTKDAVMAYVRSPKYNTNGCIFGISPYWMGADAGLDNMPHDLIQMSEHIIADDVFNALLHTLKNNVYRGYYLYGVAKYNSHLTKEHIKKIGDTLIGRHKIDDDTTKEFVKSCILNFSEDALNYLFKMITTENQYSLLHWENFPVTYQHKFLKSQPVDAVLKYLTNYSCKWTLEQKDAFLRDYYTA